MINGSLTAYIKGIDPTFAETEMRKAIYRAMESGTTEENVTQVSKLSLLDDSLNLATLSTSNAPTPQISQTPYPTIAPTTDHPSIMYTLEPTPSRASTEATETGPTYPTQVEPATEQTSTASLLQPEASTSNSEVNGYGEYDNKSAFEKIPVWVWAIAAIALCVCCTYADPNEEEEATDVHRTLHEQERRGLAASKENHDKNKDSMQDSEAFSNREYQYVRKLYRQ